MRTLVLAYKDLDEEYFSEWKQRHHESSVAMDEREEKLDKLYEEIEKDMMVYTLSSTILLYVYENIK